MPPPGFEALLSKRDTDGAAPNTELPPNMFPLLEDNEVEPKMEFMLVPPPNIGALEDVAGRLANTEPEVPLNGVDAGLIMFFPKTFGVDTGGVWTFGAPN